MKYISIALAAAALLMSGCDGSNSQTQDGERKTASNAYRTCTACHGATGLGSPAMQAPALVNLDGWYIARQLKHFQKGIRGRHPKDTYGMQMASQSGMLQNDETIEAVVRQIDSFPNRGPTPTMGANIDAGRELYALVCSSCHGPEGNGNQALNAPSLRGIDDWYLVRQYENFRQGIRGTHQDDIYGQQMQQMSSAVESKQEVKDIAAWLLSLGIDD